MADNEKTTLIEQLKTIAARQNEMRSLFLEVSGDNTREGRARRTALLDESRELRRQEETLTNAIAGLDVAPERHEHCPTCLRDYTDLETAKRIENHHSLTEYERKSDREHTLASAAEWPYVLLKAMGDSYCYMLKIRGETYPWQFESASYLSPDFVELSGVEWHPDAQVHRGFLPRTVNVRVSSIEWVVDAQS